MLDPVSESVLDPVSESGSVPALGSVSVPDSVLVLDAARDVALVVVVAWTGLTPSEFGALVQV